MSKNNNSIIIILYRFGYIFTVTRTVNSNEERDFGKIIMPYYCHVISWKNKICVTIIVRYGKCT